MVLQLEDGNTISLHSMLDESAIFAFGSYFSLDLGLENYWRAKFRSNLLYVKVWCQSEIGGSGLCLPKILKKAKRYKRLVNKIKLEPMIGVEPMTYSLREV